MSGHSRMEKSDCGNQPSKDGEPDNENEKTNETNQYENTEGTGGPSPDLNRCATPGSRSTEDVTRTPDVHASSSSSEGPPEGSTHNRPLTLNTSFDRRTSLHVATDSGNRPSSHDDRLLFCRLVILLTTACSGIMRAFIIQKVKQSGTETTLRKFLDDNSALFYNSPVTGRLRKNIDKRHKCILYTHPQGIEQWDLPLLSFVATDMCNLSRATKAHFHTLREARNFLAHVPNSMLPEREYSYYMDTIKAAHDELLKLIDDEGTREELAEMFIKTQQDNEQLTFTKCDVEIQNWAELDRHREKLDISEEGQDMINTLEALVDSMKEQNATPEVLDIVISIIVRNVGASEEHFIIKELLTHLDPHHSPPAPTADTGIRPSSPLHNVGPAIEKAIKDLLTNDREIADVQYGCKVRVKCHSYEGVKDLVFKTIQGEVTKVFRDVERNFHKFPGCENAKLDVILTEDDYCSFITKLGQRQRDTPLHRVIINALARRFNGVVPLEPASYCTQIVFIFFLWVLYEILTTDA